MKRAGRWLFNCAAAVSLVLCVATTLLWMRSHWMQDAVGSSRILLDTPSQFAFRELSLTSNEGILCCRRLELSARTAEIIASARQTPIKSLWLTSRAADPSVWRNMPPGSLGKLGFAYGNSMDLSVMRDIYDRGLVVPHWGMVYLFLIVPASWLFKKLRRRNDTSSKSDQP